MVLVGLGLGLGFWKESAMEEEWGGEIERDSGFEDEAASSCRCLLSRMKEADFHHI